jgi:hypothetical protein
MNKATSYVKTVRVLVGGKRLSIVASSITPIRSSATCGGMRRPDPIPTQPVPPAS